GGKGGRRYSVPAPASQSGVRPQLFSIAAMRAAWASRSALLALIELAGAQLLAHQTLQIANDIPAGAGHAAHGRSP
uniref:hypothetical protein n=1 Tax=Isoptericola rhizosphaerae TaxID=3377837 RepID=UPI00383AFE84